MKISSGVVGSNPPFADILFLTTIGKKKNSKKKKKFFPGGKNRISICGDSVGHLYLLLEHSVKFYIQDSTKV
jgi:hypothetical protein